MRGRRYAAFGALGGWVLGLSPEAMRGRRYAANHSVALTFDHTHLAHNALDADALNANALNTDELNTDELRANDLNADELRGIYDIIAVSVRIKHSSDVVSKAKEVLISKRVVADIRC